MPRRTLQAMIAQVQRNLAGASVPLGTIHKAIETAHMDLHQGYPWPWMVAETNILIPPPYSTGLISIMNGTSLVVGIGTNWDPTWTGRRLRMGTGNVDYIVDTITSPLSLTLRQPVNLSANVVGQGYTLYKDTFEMPADFVPGSDFYLANPTLRVRLKHVPRYHFERQMNVLRTLMTNISTLYTDAEYNTESERYQIRLAPPVGAVGEYRLVYFRMPPNLSELDQVTYFPEGFDEVIELMAEAELRARLNIPGAPVAQARAAAKIRLLKKQVAVATVENQPSTGGYPGDSSFSIDGLSIAPWSGT